VVISVYPSSLLADVPVGISWATVRKHPVRTLRWSR
jgi:hypothetical protein